jgi:hypothetical protein
LEHVLNRAMSRFANRLTHLHHVAMDPLTSCLFGLPHPRSNLNTN